MGNRSANSLENAYEVFPIGSRALLLPPATVASHLNRAHMLVAGVRVVCDLLRNSAAMTGEDGAVPLQPVTVEGLLGLTELACERFIGDLEECATEGVSHGR